RPLDDGDGKEQHHEHAERERDRDRALTTALLLRLGEDDSIWLAFVSHSCLMRPKPSEQPPGTRPRPAGSRTARTDTGSRRQTACGSRAATGCARGAYRR